jgi:RNA polymerase sigma-32 factor
VPSDGGLGRYIRQIQKYPLLTAEAEQQLARRVVDHSDRDAVAALVNAHLRLVVKIAMGYRGYALPIDELIAQGNLGLMQAVYRFDPAKGFRLSTYAMWWIRAAIQEYIVHSWSLVKIGTTSEQKRLFFGLRRAKKEIHAWQEGDLSPEQVGQIALALDVSEAEVIQMNRRLGGVDASLNRTADGEGDGQWQDWLVDNAEGQEIRLADRQEQSQRRRQLERALETLSNRERDIVSLRHLSDRPLTLEQISQRFGISRERVRQIEVGALAKLKKRVGAGDLRRSAVDKAGDFRSGVGSTASAA